MEIRELINKKFIYSGPSWAAQSFDTIDGYEKNTTNLLELWGLEDDAINISGRASTFEIQYSKIVDLNIRLSKKLPIIYISCAPMQQYNMSKIKTKIDSWYDFWDMRNNIDIKHMRMLQELDQPVGIIGAHSDIINVPDNYENITVIDSSWQNFLRRTAQLPEGYNFEADTFYNIFERVGLLNDPNWFSLWSLSEDKQFIINKLNDQFNIWDKLKTAGLFCGSHPTKRGNEMYAEYTKDKVSLFLNNFKI